MIYLKGIIFGPDAVRFHFKFDSENGKVIEMKNYQTDFTDEIPRALIGAIDGLGEHDLKTIIANYNGDDCLKDEKYRIAHNISLARQLVETFESKVAGKLLVDMAKDGWDIKDALNNLKAFYMA